jgi:hypothetical protein
MEKYNYRAALINDIKTYITNNPQEWADPFVTDDIFNYWYDILWAEDCVTGNGSNWYAKESECEEFLTHNVNLALEAFEEFAVDVKAIFNAATNGNAARFIDCTIRCYLLGECLGQVLEELNS